MAVMQTLIKPLRPRLAESSKTVDELHPRLTAPTNLYKTCDVQEQQVGDLYVYNITRKRNAAVGVTAETSLAGVIKNRIIYFAGGGWQQPPTDAHWRTLGNMITAELGDQRPEVGDLAVSVVSYPLAPKNPAKVSFPKSACTYAELMRNAHRNGERVVVMGDSAGGNLAAAIVLDALAQAVDDADPVPAPSAMFLLSPSVDLTRSNPDMETTAKLDPLLTSAATTKTAAAWIGVSSSTDLTNQGEWAAQDPRLSPLLTPANTLALLRASNVAVHGLVGTYDMLTPDALKFRDRCADVGVRGQWLVAEGQMHCFLLAGDVFAFAECKRATAWLSKVLREEFQ